MDYLGLLAEAVFLGMGIYFLLLSFGKIKVKKAEDQARIDAFFEGKTLFLQILAVFLVIIMGINLLLHVGQLF